MRDFLQDLAGLAAVTLLILVISYGSAGVSDLVLAARLGQ